MHIGFLTPEYPHSRVLASAGIGTSISSMAVALAARGVTISIFVYGQKEDHVLFADGIKIHLIRQRRFRFAGWVLYRKFLQKYLNKSIVLDKIDAIEAPDWTGITAFMKLRCPLIIRMNGSDAYFCHLESRRQKLKNYWFEKTALRGADHLLSVSQFTADKTRQIFDLKSEITVIPNSVNVKQFLPTGDEVKEKTILYFGSFIRKKGVIELAYIFNNIIKEEPDVSLTLVGKDVIDFLEKRSTLEIFWEVLSEAAHKRFEHIPEVPYDKISSIITSHAVVVFPSFAEAFPMTWLEAMAMEKALVTSNIGWAGEIMADGKTGFMVDPKDHPKFADKILKLLNGPKLRLDMGKSSRQRICEHFSAEVIAKKNIEYYKNVTGREI
ncbi:glycosyltransferase family 4 protein [Salinimicrobium oceani]|uniref:Glycosyltransferase family 4 protein n=1 Tax=Salinimicrobium oceani TaxID=2722702 RepID=A0ABX1D5J9_9FLAO|nr:glycosyltransferase family 4 protein [Salinimicrobium oceani]NJW54038.1 glycosyltransferase family 4 protein [Salinimicrobium oceani]